MRWYCLLSLLFLSLALAAGCDPASPDQATSRSAGPESASDQAVHADERVLIVERDKGQTSDTLAMGQARRATPTGLGVRITWERLKDVKFEEKMYEELGQYLLFPTFGPTVKSLEGSEILISGYVIPIDSGGEGRPPRYVLSSNPFSSCFFCGNAGPESVMELELTDHDQLYATDEFRSFQGTFRLNDSDVDRLNYLLENAVQQ